MKQKSTLLYMLGFLQKSAPLYAISGLFLGCYRLAEDIFVGQLYAAITSLNDGLAPFWGKMARLILMVIGLLLVIYFGTYIQRRAVADADLRVREKLSAHLIRVPLSVWYKRHFAQWLTILGKDTDDAVEAYKSQLPNLLDFGIRCVGGSIILFCQNWYMAVFALVIGVLYFWIGILKQKSMKNASSQKRAASAEMASQISNMIEGSWILRFYQIGVVLDQKLRRAVEETYRFGLRCARISVINGALGQLGYLLSYGGSLIFGLLLVSKKMISLPDMLAIWPIAVNVSFSLQKIGFFATSYQSTAAAVDRIRQIEELPVELDIGDSRLQDGKPQLQMDDVSFSYDGQTNILSHVSLEIQKGERVAFVGESGSGKSSLVKLLMGFYPVTEGRIQLSGKPISDYSLSAVRSCFSYVPQIPHLFEDSIIENLRMVRPEATAAEIEAACTKAYAQEFISQLPNGLATAVGENGFQLSGGQCQRIAIARAMLRGKDVLVFDEMSAALDQESEAKINDAIARIDRSKTVLMIAHRLASAQLADRIVVMSHGEIQEVGSHTELMNKMGLYYELYQKQ